MSSLQENQQPTDLKSIDDARRDFLRKSIYAAYATPVILSLLVSNASAKNSLCPGGGTWDPNTQKCVK